MLRHTHTLPPNCYQWFHHLILFAQHNFRTSTVVASLLLTYLLLNMEGLSMIENIMWKKIDMSVKMHLKKGKMREKCICCLCMLCVCCVMWFISIYSWLCMLYNVFYFCEQIMVGLWWECLQILWRTMNSTNWRELYYQASPMRWTLLSMCVLSCQVKADIVYSWERPRTCSSFSWLI